MPIANDHVSPRASLSCFADEVTIGRGVVAMVEMPDVATDMSLAATTGAPMRRPASPRKKRKGEKGIRKRQ